MLIESKPSSRLGCSWLELTGISCGKLTRELRFIKRCHYLWSDNKEHNKLMKQKSDATTKEITVTVVDVLKSDSGVKRGLNRNCHKSRKL